MRESHGSSAGSDALFPQRELAPAESLCMCSRKTIHKSLILFTAINFLASTMVGCGDGGSGSRGAQPEEGGSCGQPSTHSETAEFVVDPNYVAELDYGLSPDGSLLVVATNARLLDVDKNEEKDVYLHDYESGETKFLLRGFDGNVPNGRTGGSAFSDNGEYLFFHSNADNLERSHSLGQDVVYRYSLTTEELEVVSTWPGAAQVTGDWHFVDASADGGLVLFSGILSSDISPSEGPARHLYLKDMEAGTVELVNESEGEWLGGGLGAVEAVISGDGSTVAFLGQAPESDAFRDVDELAEDLLTEVLPIYIKNLATGEVEAIYDQPSLLWPWLDLSHDGNVLLFADASQGHFYVDGRMTEVTPDYPDDWGGWGAWGLHMTPDASRLVGGAYPEPVVVDGHVDQGDPCAQQLFFMDGLDGVPTKLEGTLDADAPKLSADGSTVVYISQTEDREHLALYRRVLP